MMPTKRRAPRSTPRVSVEARALVTVHAENLAGFLTACAANVSRTGMFIRTPAPQPAGTRIRFEFKLRDAFALVQGEGEVAWIRLQDESTDRPAGMGVRFLHLDNESEDVIDFVVDRQIRRGGDLFDLNGE